MKKLYAILGSAAIALGAAAQQLPNNGFENGWEDCVPWTSNGNTTAFGTKPVDGWWISQVAGMSGLGATVVGQESTPGYNSNSAVVLTNTPNSVKTSQSIPGYLTFGTPFSTAVGTSAKNPDGGCFGGTGLTTRPDALSFYYKRTHGTENPTERAIVIAYTWKGHTSQADVPGNLAIIPSGIKKVTMVDRDRNILGIKTAQGGAVTYSDDFALISEIQYDLMGNAEEWTNKVLEFDYKNEAAPEQINVFFCSGDFFDQANLGADNALYVDDVILVYYSRLSAIAIDGANIPDFNSDIYNYTVDTEMPESASAISVACLGNSNSAKATVELDSSTNRAIITVNNNQGTDVDGEQSHIYTIQFKEKQVDPEPIVIPENATVFVGSIDIRMASPEADPVRAGDDNTVYTVPAGDGYVDFMLPNFSMGDEVIGNIEVENVAITPQADGTMTYLGHKNGLELLGGEINVDVDLSGTLNSEGVLTMDILVNWKVSEDEILPVYVTFNGNMTKSGVADIEADTNAPVEYFNLLGVRVANPTNGVYIRRQGSSITKVLVK